MENDVKRVVAADLGQVLFDRLARFAQATGSPKTAILRLAINEFIDKHLKENTGVRERFARYTAEDEARVKAPTKGAVLTVVK